MKIMHNPARICIGFQRQGRPILLPVSTGSGRKGAMGKHLGILGGMGPLATADFLSKLTSLTPADCDQDHISSVIYCVPQIPDRTRFILGEGPSPMAHMRDGIESLRKMGAGAIVIPCNTAHFWHEALQAKCPIPILHIVDAVLAKLNDMGSRQIKHVGLLATTGTLHAEIYPKRLANLGSKLELLLPEDEIQQDYVMPGIERMKAGNRTESQRLLSKAARELAGKGAEVIIMGCTEIPPALDGADCGGATLLDATGALAEYAIRWHREHGETTKVAA